MCCRANRNSVQFMMKYFHHFSDISRLRAKADKISLSVVFVSMVVKDQLVEDMQFSL